MSIEFTDVGGRLKAFRVASGLRPEEIAARVGISRAALYRYERGEVAKVETLERFALMFGVSVPTLLGVGIEYVPSAVAFFERMRQLEAEATEIVVFFGPISYLLTSDAYDEALQVMLVESAGDPRAAEAEAGRIMSLLRARKEAFRSRRPRVRTLMAAPELSRFLREGLVGAIELDAAEHARRRRLAAAELERIAALVEQSGDELEAAVVTDVVPGTSFQIFVGQKRATLVISPFRLGAQPNVRVGVGLITAAPEAVELHQREAAELWDRALKGKAAAAHLRELVARHGQS